MFKVVNFDSNNDADIACKELFTNVDRISKKKNRVKKGKVTKIPKVVKQNVDSKNEEKIKEEIKNILQNNFDLISPSKIRSKNKKTKQKKEKQNKLVVNYQKSTENQVKNETSIPQNTQDSVADTHQKKKTKRKKKKLLETVKEVSASENVENSEHPPNRQQKQKEKLQETRNTSVKKQKSRNLNLRQRMMERLQASRFRYINEQIYSSDSKEAQKFFNEDPDEFAAYHEGYRQQVLKWPLNPLDVIIKSIQRLPKTHVIADFGCGDAKLAKSVQQKVHSFDLVAANDSVTACDMAHAPLQSGSVDVVVFCLSLMGTNLHDYLLEANRVLKADGILKIAEVESRFDDVNRFIEAIQRFRFKNTWKDLSHNLFYFLDFKKESNIKNKKKLPTVSLAPCLYKKR